MNGSFKHSSAKGNIERKYRKANENRAAHGQQAARFCTLFLYFPAFHDKIVRIDGTAVNRSQCGFVVFVEKVFFA